MPVIVVCRTDNLLPEAAGARVEALPLSVRRQLSLKKNTDSHRESLGAYLTLAELYRNLTGEKMPEIVSLNKGKPAFVRDTAAPISTTESDNSAFVRDTAAPISTTESDDSAFVRDTAAPISTTESGDSAFAKNAAAPISTTESGDSAFAKNAAAPISATESGDSAFAKNATAQIAINDKKIFEFLKNCDAAELKNTDEAPNFSKESSTYMSESGNTSLFVRGVGEFSISHTDGLCAVAFSAPDEGEWTLGVDVEKHRKVAKMEKIEEHFPVDEELASAQSCEKIKLIFVKINHDGEVVIEDDPHLEVRPICYENALSKNRKDANSESLFFLKWTMIEAVMKSDGSGFSALSRVPEMMKNCRLASFELAGEGETFSLTLAKIRA